MVRGDNESTMATCGDIDFEVFSGRPALPKNKKKTVDQLRVRLLGRLLPPNLQSGRLTDGTG